MARVGAWVIFALRHFGLWHSAVAVPGTALAAQVERGRAEVIVPNASLTSGKVANWTLSDRFRRIDFRVSVAYGTFPEKVTPICSLAGGRSPRFRRPGTR
jgi:hypothetical protein